ncbi:MAG: ClbS/DfsB family four-helix bundle protein [Actinomycetota bacterium]
MTTKKELLDEDEKRWVELCHMIEHAPESLLLMPGVNGVWTTKDVMAHIAAWHARMTDKFEQVRMTGDFGEGVDTDEFNAGVYEQCKEASMHDIRAHFETAHHRFREEVAMLEEPLDDRIARVIASNAHEHYEAHLPDLRRVLEAG